MKFKGLQLFLFIVAFSLNVNAKSYTIKLEKGNTILNVLPVNELNSIDSLTVIGVLYEDDMKVIRQCSNLRYLDLGKAYTMLSPELNNKREEDRKAFAGLMSMMATTAKGKYQKGKMSANAYNATQLLASLTKSANAVKQTEANCLIPEYTFENMPSIETIILPFRTKYIEQGNFRECPNLTEITLPQYVKSIGNSCFVNLPKLEKLVFGTTLSYMGNKSWSGNEHSFFGCTGLKEIDFSKTKMTSEPWDFWITTHAAQFTIYYPNVKVIHNEGINDEGNYGKDPSNINVYIPASVTDIEDTFDYCELHFAGKVAPFTTRENHVYTPRHCKIYVPKGCLTTYYAKYNGDDNEFFEEEK